MGEKTKVKVIAETVLIDGVYQPDQRSGEDRRKNRQAKWRFYERRQGGCDPRNEGK
ncbi:hypothetical protein VIS19158_19307, partial [Vibrio scophthalmi LMG 19158]